MQITVPNVSNYKFKTTDGQAFFVTPKKNLCIKAFQINPVNIKDLSNQKLLSLVSNYINFFRNYIADIKFISIHQDNGLKFYLLIYARNTKDMVNNIKILKSFSNSCLSLHSVDSLVFLKNLIPTKSLNFKHRLIKPNYFYDDKSHYYTIITLKNIGKGLFAFWLANLVNYSNNSLIMSVGTQNKAEIRPKINRSISELESQITNPRLNPVDNLDSNPRITRLINLDNDIKNNSETLKKVNTQIIISASSLKDLDKRIGQFKKSFSHFKFSIVNRYASYDIKNLLLPIKHHLNLLESYDLGGSYMFTNLNDFNNPQLNIENSTNSSFHFTRLFGQVIPLSRGIRIFGSIYLSDTFIVLIGLMVMIAGNGLFKGGSLVLPLIFDIPIILIIIAILLFKHRN